MYTLLIAALALPTAGAGALHEPVMELLNSYEATASTEQLSALGGGVVDELMAIADDGQVPSTRRGRALSALGGFPDDETRAFLERHLADAEASSLLRRKAAYALAAGWREAAVAPLSAALSDGDVQLRIAAADALTGLPGDAVTALKARLAVEDSEAVRQAIEKAMGAQ